MGHQSTTGTHTHRHTHPYYSNLIFKINWLHGLLRSCDLCSHLITKVWRKDDRKKTQAMCLLPSPGSSGRPWCVWVSGGGGWHSHVWDLGSYRRKRGGGRAPCTGASLACTPLAADRWDTITHNLIFRIINNLPDIWICFNQIIVTAQIE